jgi:hypothetical protein
VIEAGDNQGMTRRYPSAVSATIIGDAAGFL